MTILLDGRPVPAHAGESVATALLAVGLRAWRRSPRRGEPRGPFCMMGICQECLVTINGRRAQACLVPVREGMAVATEGPAA